MEDFYNTFNSFSDAQKKVEQEHQRKIKNLEDENKSLHLEKCDIAAKLQRFEELGKERRHIVSRLYKMNEPDSEQEDEDNCGINCARNGKRSAGSIDREKLTRKLNTVAKTQNQKLLEPVRTAAEVLRNPTKSTTNFNPSLDEFIPFNCEQTVRSATKAVHTGAPLVICKSVSPRALLNRSSFADTVKRATQNALRRSNVKNPCTLFQKGLCKLGDNCHSSHDVIPSIFCEEYNNMGSCSMARCHLRHEVYDYRPSK